MEWKSKRQHMGILALVAFTMLAAGSIAAQAQTTKRFLFGWPANFNLTMAHLEFGRQLGFFKEEGIDLEIVSIPTGAYAALQQILSGGIHTGLIGVESSIVSLQRGRTLPIRFVYNHMRESMWEVVVPENSPIKTFSDLRGKKIGISAAGSGSVPNTKAILAASGVKTGEFEFVVVGFGAPAKQAITRGDIDALALFDVPHAQIEDSNLRFRRLQNPAEFAHLPSHGFPVLQSLMESDPALIANFGRAVTRSIIACTANEEGCVKAFWKTYPAFKNSSGTDEENLKRDVSLVHLRNVKMSSFGGSQARLYGAYSDEEWRAVIKSLQLGGLITDTNIDLKLIYSNQFVKDYNQLNEAATIQAAKAYK